MIRAGLTGGYASGKSFVAAEFARLGCEVIHADALGHAVLQPDGEAFEPVLALFGDEILSPKGVIDRRKLAALVFPSPDLLRELEAIVHPAVFRKEEQIADSLAERRPDAILIYEAAILIETGRYQHYDHVILTLATPEIQMQRGMQRDNLSTEQISARMVRQLPDEQKRCYADFIIDTSGTKPETQRQVHQVWQALKEEASSRNS